MENLSKMESFESFQVSKQSMNQIAGGRTRRFEKQDGYNGNSVCLKIVDNNSGMTIKKKLKDDSRCE
ncbi:hypothetical protein [Tenacibaculum sp. Ill]|uniref:hypothetical protein n=1 Tax=Tenacibaculum sp. Ill TaxID=3445935 RepID=UPI003F79A780